MSLSRYLELYKSVSRHWCVGLTFDFVIGLKKPKDGLTDFLGPSGSRTTTRSGTLGPSFKTILSNRMKSTQQTLRNQLRQQIRKTRANLTALQQQQAEDSITQQALALIEAQNAQHIALYVSFDGEISTEKLIKTLWAQDKHVYLPVLHPFNPNHLLFLRYLPDTPMLKNKFGIWEPKLNVQNVLPLDELDILFTPLVAFDKQGNRLGMGGGFYDRTLQNWQNSSFIPVGLAHQCQQVEQLPTEAWDVPLHRILVA
jgi:5-formyltetrahydrofolate cyclo-ligase